MSSMRCFADHVSSRASDTFLVGLVHPAGPGERDDSASLTGTTRPGGRRAPHHDPLMRAPAPDHRDVGAVDPLDAHVHVLSGVRRVRAADHFVLAACIPEAIAEL
jgi:hypothetical protein